MNTADLLGELEAKASPGLWESSLDGTAIWDGTGEAADLWVACVFVPDPRSRLPDERKRANATLTCLAVNRLRPLVEALLSRVDKCYCDRPDSCPHDVSGQALAALHTDLEAALKEAS